MSSPIPIRLLDVVKHYRTPAGVVRAVDGIDLELEPGTGAAITGPSGCGKSTLLGLIGGLEAPTRGSVRLGDREISALPERARAGVRRPSASTCQTSRTAPEPLRTNSNRATSAGASPHGPARSA